MTLFSLSPLSIRFSFLPLQRSNQDVELEMKLTRNSYSLNRSLRFAGMDSMYSQYSLVEASSLVINLRVSIWNFENSISPIFVTIQPLDWNILQLEFIRVFVSVLIEDALHQELNYTTSETESAREIGFASWDRRMFSRALLKWISHQEKEAKNKSWVRQDQCL